MLAGYNTTPEQVETALRRGYEQAAATRPPVERLFRIGPVAVRVRIVGAGLAQQLLPAFAHLPETAEPARITVALWSGDTVPGHPLDRLWSGPSSEPWGIMVSDASGRRLHDWRPNADLVLDLLNGTLFGYFDGADTLKPDQAARPLQRLIGAVLATENMATLHGAVIGRSGRAILLTARGGGGKSTTALAGLAAGLDFLADDTVAVRATSEQVTAFGIYATALAETGPLAADRLARLPEPTQFHPSVERRLLFRLSGTGLPLATQSEVTAVVIPRVAGRRKSVLLPGKPMDLIVAALQHSFTSTNLARQVTLDQMVEMSRRLPIWRLELGTDIDDVIATVGRVLDGRHDHDGQDCVRRHGKLDP